MSLTVAALLIFVRLPLSLFARRRSHLTPTDGLVASTCPQKMTTMVASHHADLWQQRDQPNYHISSMNLPSLMPPFETQRTVTNPPTPRAYHQTSSSVEMSMPLFSTNNLVSSLPYHSGAFPFDSVLVNPYNMQQAYPMGYAADVPHPISYARSNMVQQMPAMQEVRTAFSANHHSAKSATASPSQSSSPYYESAYGTELEPTHPETIEGTNTNFSTDVDTLMKAIQAKQPDTQPAPQITKVRLSNSNSLELHVLTLHRQKRPTPIRNQGNGINVTCLAATRASTRRHILRSTFGHTLVQSRL